MSAATTASVNARPIPTRQGVGRPPPMALWRRERVVQRVVLLGAGGWILSPSRLRSSPTHTTRTPPKSRLLELAPTAQPCLASVKVTDWSHAVAPELRALQAPPRLVATAGGIAAASVRGAYLHGVLDHPALRSAYPNGLRAGLGPPARKSVAPPVDDDIDRLADHVEAHLDAPLLGRILRLQPLQPSARLTFHVTR